MSSSISSLTCESNASSKILQKLKNDGCDINLYGKGDEEDGVNDLTPIKAHKMVLSAASPHMKEAFSSVGFRDSNAKDYTIEAIDHASLKIIVDYIYGGGLQWPGDACSVKFVKRVLIGADYLHMPHLVQVCENVFIIRLRQGGGVTAAYLDAWQFGKKYRFAKLADRAVGGLISRSATEESVHCNEVFLNMSAEDAFSLLKEMVVRERAWYYGYDREGCRDDDEVYFGGSICDAAAAWLEHDEAGRSEFALKLMCSMPLSSATPNELEKLIEKKVFSEDVVTVVRGFLQVRKERVAWKKRCETSEMELRQAKRKIEEFKGVDHRADGRFPRAMRMRSRSRSGARSENSDEVQYMYPRYYARQ